MRKLLPETLGGVPLYNYWNQAITNIRERQFSKLVSEVRPRRIMEIGVAQGGGAERIIKAAKREPSELEYFGFDLFYKCKANAFICPTEAEIRRKLMRLGVGKIVLIAGDTLETLPREIPRLPKMDFIYIDGCHSYSWVKSDWENAKRLMHPKTVVVFDDYPMAGVKRVVDKINDYDVRFICPWLMNRIKFCRGVIFGAPPRCKGRRKWWSPASTAGGTLNEVLPF